MLFIVQLASRVWKLNWMNTMFVRLHAHCAWTITEHSPWFKPIVIDQVCVDQTLTNPNPLLPINTIYTRATVMHAELINFHVNSTFAPLTSCKMHEIAQAIPCSDVLWGVHGNSSMHVYTNEYGNIAKLPNFSNKCCLRWNFCHFDVGRRWQHKDVSLSEIR